MNVIAAILLLVALFAVTLLMQQNGMLACGYTPQISAGHVKLSGCQ